METHRERRGELKIFFGYAAGVGKTSAMLKSAWEQLEKGRDVVCGHVEQHSRASVLEMAAELPQVPEKENRELDLDGLMARRPELAVVDELAHTNRPGGRHEKRYQDIEELLNSGIDVYTTLNVQHLESLCDVAASITGTIVRERIPDKIFDRAAQVELVDLEPEELRRRIREGDVVRESQIETALQNYFTLEKLTALRKLALRRCAERSGHAGKPERRKGAGEFRTEESILVGLSSSPSNEKILRAAARMAGAFGGRLTALFVETPETEAMNRENKERLRNHMHLAEQLGAVIETVYGEDVAFQIAEYARISGTTKVVVGRSGVKKNRFSLKASFSEKLTFYLPDIDIYIIPEQETAEAVLHRKKVLNEKLTSGDFVKSLLILVGATIIGKAFQSLGFGEANIIMVYILGVLVTAVATSHRVFSLCSSLVSVLAFNFFFTKPEYTLKAYDASYPVTFLIMFTAAFLASSLALKIKKQARQSAKTAYRTQVLLDTNQLLQQEKDGAGIAKTAVRQLMKLLKRDIIYYGASGGSLEEPLICPAGEDGRGRFGYLDDNEKAVAAWVYRNNKRAGASTSTLGSAKCLYLAIRSQGAVYGVVGIALEQGESLSAFENNLVLSILLECAVALEKEQLRQKREEAQAQAKNEQLRANLLRSISHDLRTPLTSISGNAGILMSNSLDEITRKRLYTDIYDDSMWLYNLVENLLSVTRMEDGTMHINMQAELLEELVMEALRHVSRKSKEHVIRAELPDDLQLVRVDSKLIVQVLINLVDNAIKYTPGGSEIVIRSRAEGGRVLISVADDGPGIPDEQKSRVFEMFYTAGNTVADSRRGMGLGLALCKSIITAHGGQITVTDNSPHGAVFTFSLTAEEVKIHE